MAVGNMHRKIGKDHACGSEISWQTDRQTDTGTQACLSQYLTATPLREVKMMVVKIVNMIQYKANITQ